MVLTIQVASTYSNDVLNPKIHVDHHESSVHKIQSSIDKYKVRKKLHHLDTIHEL